MFGCCLPPLFAVHVADGVLAGSWVLGGWVVAGLLAFWGAWRIRDEEIPQVALLTAAFFVASLVHVPIGPTSAHLILNGLLGVVLGRRALLAVPLGLVLQAILIGHGGLLTVGVNSVVMGVPALLAWLLFAGLQRLPWLRSPWFGMVLIGGSTLLWVLSVVYSVSLLVSNWTSLLDVPDLRRANEWTFAPLTLAAAAGMAGLAAWFEQRMRSAREFPLGVLVGEFAVMATALLNCAVLLWGGQEHWQQLALVVFVVHLPIAVVEGVVVGSAVGFLAQVKPAMLRWPVAQEAPCPVDSAL